MSCRLIESNLKNDAAGLNEVADLMREIKSAWDVVVADQSEQSTSAAK